MTSTRSCYFQMKIMIKSCFFIVGLILCLEEAALATEYYVHPIIGNDNNSGTSKTSPFQSLKRVSQLNLQPGDRVLLAEGQIFNGNLRCIGWIGTSEKPIIIQTEQWSNETSHKPAFIDAKNFSEGVLLQDCSHVYLRNIEISANGYTSLDSKQIMRVAVLLKINEAQKMTGIRLEKLLISNVYFENPGVVRTAEEVKSANGTQKYGWGIRLINQRESSIIEDIRITECTVENVSHTGIKLTGKNQNIQRVTISDNIVSKTGGPGIQMSGIRFVYVSENKVTNSGSNDDTRKWGRGSGLWTWGASNVLIEKNSFMYANGPGDSAGAHIDFNCDNVVMQYNFSAYNAGGFCEILGNNFNCAYRYNISVDDGYRVKGENGAFQEGKIFWLSGYQGNQRERKGPVNTYFYNNTIYSSTDKVAKIAIDNRSQGVLIANNIFYIPGGIRSVKGDQYLPDNGLGLGLGLERIHFTNNLYLNANDWPSEAIIQDQNALLGNPEFLNPGGRLISDYLPKNKALIKSKGKKITLLTDDNFGLLHGLNMTTDILGNPIPETPSLGAIEITD